MVFVKLVPVCELKEEHKALESTLFVTPFTVRLFFEVDNRVLYGNM